jgi:hypothetical protein
VPGQSLRRLEAGLFVFTFSRNTFPPGAEPVPGESFVFIQFSGQPQCFLTGAQLVAEFGVVGFAPSLGIPFSEYNRPQPGTLRSGTPPVISEAAFVSSHDWKPHRQVSFVP